MSDGPIQQQPAQQQPIQQQPIQQQPAQQQPAQQPAAAPATAAAARRIDRFLKLTADRGASDLHISCGRPPMLRRSGRLEAVRYRVIDERDFEVLMKPATPEVTWSQFEERGDADFAYEVEGLARFRVNLFRQQRGSGAVFRLIPSQIMTLTDLGLPDSLRTLLDLKAGLVLVTGPTGSGKSTTLAAILHEINQRRPLHFITIEDPIEFVHENQRCLISQRELGTHTPSFAHALRMALREDPDAILVGEMRDLETIEIALGAADTGLLVFGTLHTNSAAKTIDRLVSVFPASRSDEVRGVLSSVTRGIVAQQLLPRKEGGRVAAVELLLTTPALVSSIREGKSHQIPDIISGGKKQGMVAMDESLRALVDQGIVEPQDALDKALDKDSMRRFLKERGAELAADMEE